MPLARLFNRTIKRTRTLPVSVRYAFTISLTATWMLIRYLLDAYVAPVTPFSLGAIIILFCAILFDAGSGIVATLIITAFTAWFALDIDTWSIPLGTGISIANFVISGVITALVVETLHHSIAHLLESEQARLLLLKEFRHRTRNDLQSLVSLLMLRARSAPTRESKEALEEAAGHAMALARVHTWLVNATPGDSYEALVDTKQFIHGLCHELAKASDAQGLRPFAIVPIVEAHWLPTERAVQLGLVVNETVTNAIKYAFPGDTGGHIVVKFAREEDVYRLTVCDNGVGIPEENMIDPTRLPSLHREPHMGTRLLRGLAAQLRGTFTRNRSASGGTKNELVFPALAPTMIAGRGV